MNGHPHAPARPVICRRVRIAPSNPGRGDRLGQRPIYDGRSILLTTETGEYTFIPVELLRALVKGSLPGTAPCYRDLVAKSVIADDGLPTTVRRLAWQYRSKRPSIFDGPSLFIFVVTLQ